MENEKYLVVQTTTNTRDEAEKLASELVSGNLAACVQIHQPIKSVYQWKGKTEVDEEFLLSIKTISSKYQALESKILEIHSYDTPEIIALDIQQGSTQYLNWMKETLSL